MSWIGNGGKDIENTGNVNVEVKKMAGVDIRKEIISKTRIGKKGMLEMRITLVIKRMDMVKSVILKQNCQPSPKGLQQLCTQIREGKWKWVVRGQGNGEQKWMERGHGNENFGFKGKEE